MEEGMTHMQAEESARRFVSAIVRLVEGEMTEGEFFAEVERIDGVRVPEAVLKERRAWCVKCARLVLLEDVVHFDDGVTRGTCPNCLTLVIKKREADPSPDAGEPHAGTFICRLVDAPSRCSLVGSLAKLTLRRRDDGLWQADARSVTRCDGTVDLDASYQSAPGDLGLEDDAITLTAADETWRWRKIRGPLLCAYEEAHEKAVLGIDR